MPAWFPVTFEDDADQVGLVHDYLNPMPGKGCYETWCGRKLSTSHGVVSATTSKPWCPDCEQGVSNA